MNESPHAEAAVRSRGPSPGEARAALVLIHGRGASAESMFSLAEELDLEGLAIRAPQAVGHTWYPHSFLAPLERNEPHLASALAKVDAIVQELTGAGIPADRIVLLGFSQGACLASEYAARHPKRFGGVVALSGGLIGNVQQEGSSPDDKGFEYEGSLAGTPVFLGCSDRDPHIPLSRVTETAAVLNDLGGDVTKRIYENMGHTVNQDEIAFVRELVQGVVQGPETE